MIEAQEHQVGERDQQLEMFIHQWADGIVSNDVARLEEFTTEDWVLIDRPGTISRETFHNVVRSGTLEHHWMTHDVLEIKTCGEVAIVRTRGRNTASFNGELVSADEWTTNLLTWHGDRWRCFLTQLTPTTSDHTIRITRVTPVDWRRFRAARLAALGESPDMFGSTLARETAFEEDEWRRRASRPVTFIASRAGSDVGLAGVHEFDGEWQVVSMWITPMARGTGVVDTLMEACEEAARDAGASHLTLGVMEDNPAGRGAYERLGFTYTGKRDHIRDGRDELWMSKELS